MKKLVLTLAVLMLPLSVFAGEIVFGWNKVNEAGGIQDMKFMPDESQFIITTIGKELQIRNSENGELVQKYPGIEGLFEFTTDSNRLVIVSWSQTKGAKIELRNLSDMSLIKKDSIELGKDTLDPIYQSKLNLYFIDLKVDPIRPYAYVILQKTNNKQPNYIDTTSLIVYNYETMKQVATLTTAVINQNQYYGSHSLAVSKDGKYLAAINTGISYLKVWDLNTMQLIRNFQLYDSELQDDYLCEPSDIKFAEKNTENIYYSGVFPSQTITTNNGLFIYGIKEEKIIYDKFHDIVGGKFVFFDNERKIMHSNGFNLSVLNLQNETTEFSTIIWEVDSLRFASNIIYSNNFKYFIGNSGQKMTMVKYNSIDGILEKPDNKQIIFPNPTNNFVIVKIDCDLPILEYRIIDTNGKLIKKSTAQNFKSSIQIDFSSYQAGVYILKLSCGKTISTYKIIKEK